ncbi:nodulation efficiency protein NfeD [Bacillus sp. DNRA2]|nr:nodulation efficiency protein NfeD [Bacillus sp. DNRA2]
MAAENDSLRLFMSFKRNMKLFSYSSVNNIMRAKRGGKYLRKFILIMLSLFIIFMIIIPGMSAGAQVISYGAENVQSDGASLVTQISQMITHPVTITILLTLGCLGLVLELFSPGFGIFGFIGLSALLLFFYGHLVSGLAGFETLILFVVGIALVVVELFVPGGIIGTIGALSILGSLFLAADNAVYMGISILIAIGVSILASVIMIRVFGKKMSLFKKIILTDSTDTQSGYVSNRNRTELLGLKGVTITALRPAGTVLIGEERIDVVSEGEFIPKDSEVIVVKVEGARIVVRTVH